MSVSLHAQTAEAAERDRRVRLAALKAVSAPSWQRPGCSARCRETRAVELGSLRPIGYVEHDPVAHEEYGRLLAQQLLPSATRPVVRTGGLVIDRNDLTVTAHGRPVLLTPRELQIILALSERPGATYTARELIYAVWGAAWIAPGDAAELAVDQSIRHMLRTNMARLRTKLGACRDLIVTRPHIGYQLLDVPPEVVP